MNLHRILGVTTSLLLTCMCSSASAEKDLVVIGFNVEGMQPGGSWDSTVETVSRTVREIGPADVWGFSEVPNLDWVQALTRAAGSRYLYMLGSTGSSDRLAIVWDANKLQLKAEDGSDADPRDPGFDVTDFELMSVYDFLIGNDDIGGRAPLVARFEVRGSGEQFWFMVNHLHRTKGSYRHKQAELLNEWVQGISNPVIAVGDYNFDYGLTPTDPAIHTGNRDAGFDNMVAGDRFLGVEPQELVRTQVSDVEKTHYNGVLDFVFVAGEAQQWESANVASGRWRLRCGLTRPALCLGLRAELVRWTCDLSTQDGMMKFESLRSRAGRPSASSVRS